MENALNQHRQPGGGFFSPLPRCKFMGRVISAVAVVRDSGWKVWDGLRMWVWDGGFRIWKMQIWGSGLGFRLQEGCEREDLGRRSRI